MTIFAYVSKSGGGAWVCICIRHVSHSELAAEGCFGWLRRAPVPPPRRAARPYTRPPVREHAHICANVAHYPGWLAGHWTGRLHSRLCIGHGCSIGPLSSHRIEHLHTAQNGMICIHTASHIELAIPHTCSSERLWLNGRCLLPCQHKLLYYDSRQILDP